MTLLPDIDTEIYQIFIKETLQLLEKIEEILVSFNHDYNSVSIEELVRAAHTIKGGAAQIQFSETHTIAARLETFFRRLKHQDLNSVDLDLFNLLIEGYELLRLSVLSRIENNGTLYNHEDLLAKSEPIFIQLDTLLEESLIIDDCNLPKLTEVEPNIGELICNTEIAEAIGNLEKVLVEANDQELLIQLQGQIAIFLDLGQILGISEFISIAQTTIVTLEANPQAVRNIGQLALAGFRSTQKAALKENHLLKIQRQDQLVETKTFSEEAPIDYDLNHINKDLFDLPDLSEQELLETEIFSEKNPTNYDTNKIENNLVNLPEHDGINETTSITPTIEKDLSLTNSIDLEHPSEIEESLSDLSILPVCQQVKISTAKLLIWRDYFAIFILPYNQILENLSSKFSRITHSEDQNFLHWQSKLLPIYQLSELISYNYSHPDINFTTVQTNKESLILVIRLKKSIIALELTIEKIITTRELIIKPFNKALTPPCYIYGCVIFENQLPIPAINIAILLEQIFDSKAQAISVSKLFKPAKDISVGNELKSRLSTSTNYTPKVLITDDSSTWRKLLSLTLEKEGYKVLLAKDGQEGIMKLKQNSNIQLIISDLEMPNLNGFEFLNYCRQRLLLTEVPFIFLSTCNTNRHRELAKKLGATAYLTKPYNESELLRTLRSILMSEE